MRRVAQNRTPVVAANNVNPAAEQSGDVIHDGLFEFVDTFEYATPYALRRDLAEPSLDEIKPR